MSGGFNGSTAEDFGGLPRVLGPVVVEHGQAMVALVYGAGMAAEAARVLGQVREPQAQHALRVLAEVFNQTSTALCKLQGWTEEALGLCQRDIELAFAGAVLVPEQRIVLAS